MPQLHGEVLTEKQKPLLSLLREFSENFYLVGGTAIALHIGHRESIDFDLFSPDSFENLNIRKKIIKNHKISKVLVDNAREYTLLVDGVKLTFAHYPFEIERENKFKDIIELPNLLSLAAMKAYALGRRAKWKDYVDMYFVMKNYHTLEEIADKARDIFGTEFNEKLLRSQLVYFSDIDYSEQVVFKKGFKVDEEVIKDYLKEISTS